MNGLGDPLPLGDEVSEGRLSEARDLPSFNTEGFQCNTILHAKNSPCPSPKINPNPNRVQGIIRKNVFFHNALSHFERDMFKKLH